MFRRFMYGRYGTDHLNLFILGISLFFGLLSVALSGVAGLVFTLLQLMALAYCVLRTLSRNHANRRRENEAFLRFWNKLKRSRVSLAIKKFFGAISGFFKRAADRDHKYFKCPSCKSRLRVPRGRGEITVTCPRCRNKFDKKS